MNKREDRSTRLGLMFYNFNEGSGPKLKTAQWMWHPKFRGWYFGVLAKGWWKFGPSTITNYFELEFAIGGEDNMVQFGVVIPFLGRVTFGLRIPRVLTKGWIYQRREWTVKVGYVGHWLDVCFASEEHMRDTGMVSYYKRKKSQPPDCECHDPKRWHEDPVLVEPYSVKPTDDIAALTKHVPNPSGRCITPAEINHNSTPCACQGYVAAKSPWNRMQLWPGWHFTFDPRLTDKILGKRKYESRTEEEVRTVVPMPEGNYPAMVKLNVDTWTRARWPWSRKVLRRADVKMDVPIPVPGKGENAWDIDDDAVFSQYGVARNVAEAVSHVVRSALDSRERHGGKDWVPDAGWPVGREDAR